jgi:hypothetical protein
VEPEPPLHAAFGKPSVHTASIRFPIADVIGFVHEASLTEPAMGVAIMQNTEAETRSSARCFNPSQ